MRSLALAAIVAVAAGGGAHGGLHVTDVVGDAGAADITRVTIASDASGSVSLSVTARGMFSIDRGWEPDVSVWLDTDRDGSTGSASGSEYGLTFWRSPTGPVWHTLRWNATDGKWDVSPASTYSRAGDVLTWRFPAADLGGATGFDFWIAAATYEDKRIVAEDVAPATGRWHVDLSASPVGFRDPPHDSAAPDIAAITVGTDAKTSVTTLAVTARGLAAISPALRPEVDAYLNTDGNQATGWVGFDYRLYYARSPAGTVWRVDRWGKRAHAWRRVATATASVRRGDVLRWHFTRADIGGAPQFTFILVSTIAVSGGFITDSAPGFGAWAYRFPA